MTDHQPDIDTLNLAAALLEHYCFDLNGQTVGQLLATWLQQVPPAWIRAAVVEALYQGRYKAVSVGQILNIWQRRETPLCHFNSEFERIVSSPLMGDFEVPPIAEELRAIARSAVAESQMSNANGQSAAQAEETAEAQPSETLQVDEGDRKSIPTFRPATVAPEQVEPQHWPAPGKSHESIHQFVPNQQPSNFYQRLRAIAAKPEGPPRPTDPLQSASSPLKSTTPQPQRSNPPSNGETGTSQESSTHTCSSQPSFRQPPNSTPLPEAHLAPQPHNDSQGKH